jgi:predicted O-methyltransferase YrrM
MSAIEKIAKYCESHTSLPHELLYELERETHLKTLSPQMLSGHWQGQTLAILSALVRPKLALEIGAFTGYSAICIAQGLHPSGCLHTIEVNPETAVIAKRYFDKAGLGAQIKLHLGDARSLIPEIEGAFDLVFIDAGKLDYQDYYDLCIDRIRPGGLLIADNVLWSGKVAVNLKDKDTLSLDAFNKKVHRDPRVSNLILPIRDGLLVALKK